MAIESSEVVRRVGQTRTRDAVRLGEHQQTELVDLGRSLQAAGYEFVAVSQETRRRVNERAPHLARTLRDVFGWNRPFTHSLLPTTLLSALERAELVHEENSLLRSRVSFASVGRRLFAHSAHPNDRSLFFGPNTYRYVSSIKRHPHIARRTVEIGGGTGVGGIIASGCSDSVVIAHESLLALDFARVNAALAGINGVRLVHSDGLRNVEGNFDLILANPSFATDAQLNEARILEIVRQGIGRLASGGTLLACTSVPIVNGEDPFRGALESLVAPHPCRLEYAELDPDTPSEDAGVIEHPGLERVAAVSFTITARTPC